jgi:hypothetical protein
MDEPSFLDHVADGIGSAIEGTFWCIGRVSPAIEDASKAIAQTRAGRHVVHHAHTGWAKGYNSCLKSREKRERRKARAQWFRAGKEVFEEVVDSVQEDIQSLRGNPRARPAPG